MLHLGASGGTSDQLSSVLHTQGLTAVQQAAGWQSLAADMAQSAASDGIQLSSANSLWLQPGYSVEPSFLSNLTSYFDSGVWNVDFQDNPTVAAQDINSWVSKQTAQHISSLFAPGQLNSYTRFVLANAVYFQANWQQKFKGAVSDLPFFSSSGKPTPVPFMQTPPNEPLDVPVSITKQIEAVQLPYTGSHFAALVIMPSTESVQQFVSDLSANELASITRGLENTRVSMAMPSVNVDVSQNLIPALKSMGLSDLFGPNANLKGISNAPLVVNAIQQAVSLSVTKDGTVGAAASGIGGLTGGENSQASITVNHPFVVLVRNTQNNAIVFASVVTQP
jgi:serpin B